MTMAIRAAIAQADAIIIGAGLYTLMMIAYCGVFKEKTLTVEDYSISYEYKSITVPHDMKSYYSQEVYNEGVW